MPNRSSRKRYMISYSMNVPQKDAKCSFFAPSETHVRYTDDAVSREKYDRTSLAKLHEVPRGCFKDTCQISMETRRITMSYDGLPCVSVSRDAESITSGPGGH